jgi:hypothetical protein
VKLLKNGESEYVMSQIKSEQTHINCTIEKIYNFLSDFNNFKKLMPEQVQNWKSTEDSCSFEISGMGHMALKMVEKVPYSKIKIVPEVGTKIPFTFELICLLKKLQETETESEFVFEHEMPAMISLMASRPLQNLVDIFGKRLKEYFEKTSF